SASSSGRERRLLLLGGLRGAGVGCFLLVHLLLGLFLGLLHLLVGLLGLVLGLVRGLVHLPFGLGLLLGFVLGLVRGLLRLLLRRGRGLRVPRRDHGHGEHCRHRDHEQLLHRRPPLESELQRIDCPFDGI